MVTLSSCLIWQIISFILPSNEYGCVYAWTTLGNMETVRLTCYCWQHPEIYQEDPIKLKGGATDRQVAVAVYWLIWYRVVVQTRGQTKIILRRQPLSRFLVRTLRVNKIVLKSFSKICRSDSTLNCRSHHSCKKLTLTT